MSSPNVKNTSLAFPPRLSHRSVGFVCLMVAAFAQVVIAQHAAISPPPDERFKADILVIVGHPDDESLIAGYLARAVLDEHKRVAVVFATRGDAGQNLVGYEQGRALAETRETEAREALGSIGIYHAWFLRAPDTPYPDVPDVLRSLESWNHGNVLGEMVRFIRLTRPEVVITMRTIRRPASLPPRRLTLPAIRHGSRNRRQRPKTDYGILISWKACTHGSRRSSIILRMRRTSTS